MSNLSEDTLKIIEEENIKPTPKCYFLFKNYLFWLLLCISVIVGSLAVATCIFLLAGNDWHARRYLDRTFVDHALLSIPYLWFFVFVLLLAVANFEFKCTKKGYKYSIFLIAFSSVFLSVFLGFVFFFAGFNYKIHETLFRDVPLYDFLTYTNEDIWRSADIGLLGGRVVYFKDKNNFIIQDFNNKIWRVKAASGDISWQNNLEIKKGIIVRLVGYEATGDNFFANTARPWKD